MCIYIYIERERFCYYYSCHAFGKVDEDMFGFIGKKALGISTS